MKWDRNETARFIGTVAVAMLIAGYLRYAIQGELLTFSKGLLIAGTVFILAALVIGFQGVVAFFSKRSAQQGANTSVLAIAVIAILAIANFVGFRHHKRFDLTTEKMYTLSDQTRQIVSSLQKDLVVIRFDKAPSAGFDDLMTEYKTLSPRFKSQTVDPNQKPEVVQEYGATRMGEVFVGYGDRKSRIETGAQGEVSEQDVTGAILKITSDKVKTICFVTGHGERSITDTSQEGYNQAGEGLKKENYLTKTVNLIAESGVPADCAVVVIAGPKQSFYPQETAWLGKYLDAAGDALILVDPITDPKLDDLFQSWNVIVGNNIVIDASGMGQVMGAGPTIPIVADFGASPITRGFERSATFFPMARTASIADKSKTIPEMVDLLKTSERSFTVPSLPAKGGKLAFDPKTDTRGPLTLGVSGNRKVGERKARLVVIGNSQFAMNPYITQLRNGDLFYNTIDWLAADENLISIRPKAATNRRVTLSAGQATALKWLDLFFLPGLVILAGIMIWLKRR
jgi:ABC-type uncharacterized transport system involved in gliding motility auxiliary subunit